jgi:transposase InsO family protein
MEFITRLNDGERMTDLCREFGVSRKTGYKILNRYRDHGPPGLLDSSRAPGVVPHATPEAIVKLILELKHAKPSWGAKKLREILMEHHTEVRIPARSTVHEILVRHGLVEHRRRRRRASPTPVNQLTRPHGPNDVWGADYKGQFRMLDRNYCYPLTISDLYSRELLISEALGHTREEEARITFDWVFNKYGLPRVIRTDNGSPFASTGLLGLSKLSVWWMTQGIIHERIEPGHPEQNGIHERMHRTLKRETTRPPGQNLLAQQQKFDAFKREFNEERPHEGIGMKRPAQLYRPSEHTPQPFDGEYPLHDIFRKVLRCGRINLGKRERRCYISTALSGQKVGLREINDELWLVTFMNLDLGHVDMKRSMFEPMPQNTALREPVKSGEL